MVDKGFILHIMDFSLKTQIITCILCLVVNELQGYPQLEEKATNLLSQFAISPNKKIEKRNAEWSNRNADEHVESTQTREAVGESGNYEATTNSPKIIRVRLHNGSRSRQFRKENGDDRNKTSNTSEPAQKQDGKVVRVKKFKRKKPAWETTTQKTTTTPIRITTPRYIRQTTKAPRTTRVPSTQSSAYAHITVVNKIERDQKPKRKEKVKNYSLWVPATDSSERIKNVESSSPSSRENERRNSGKQKHQNNDFNLSGRESEETLVSSNYKSQRLPAAKIEIKSKEINRKEISTKPLHDPESKRFPEDGISQGDHFGRLYNPSVEYSESKQEHTDKLKPVLGHESLKAKTHKSEERVKLNMPSTSRDFEILDDKRNIEKLSNDTEESKSTSQFNQFETTPLPGPPYQDFGVFNGQFPSYGNSRFHGRTFDTDPFFQSNQQFPPPPIQQPYNPFYGQSPQQYPPYYSGPQQIPPSYSVPGGLGFPQYQPSPHLLSVRRSILDTIERDESSETTTEFSLPKFEIPSIDFNDRGCRTVYKEVNAVPGAQPYGLPFENKAKSVIMTRECFFPDGVPTTEPKITETTESETTT